MHDQQAGDGQELRASWQAVGAGYRRPEDALLAHTTRNDARAAREAARELRKELKLIDALASC